MPPSSIRPISMNVMNNAVRTPAFKGKIEDKVRNASDKEVRETAAKARDSQLTREIARQITDAKFESRQVKN